MPASTGTTTPPAPSSVSVSSQRSQSSLTSPPSSPGSAGSTKAAEVEDKDDGVAAGEVLDPLDDRKHFPLLAWSELSPWMKEFESEYTLVGYRREQNSVLGCFYSAVGYLHNETCNILTHGLGALYLLPHIYSHLFLPAIHRDSLRWTDKMHFTIFLSSAAICLGLSGCYHTLSCHSRSVAKLWNRLDYVGIVILIVGSNFPALYYGFYCDLALQWLYTSVITILGAMAVYTVLSEKFTTGAYRWARTLVFISLGLSAVVPVSHALLAYGVERASNELGLKWLLGSGALYIIGALNYALRYPERHHPRTFDLFGSSHQLFHVAVLAAAFMHYKAIEQGLVWHHDVNDVKDKAAATAKELA